MITAYTLGRFLHFLGLLLWISGFFAVLKSARIFLRLQKRSAYVPEEILPIVRPAVRFASHLGMVLAWLGGLSMLHVQRGLMHLPWMQLKIAGLAVLSIVTLLAYSAALGWSRGMPLQIPWWMRLVDPLLIVIVALAVFRPG